MTWGLSLQDRSSASRASSHAGTQKAGLVQVRQDVGRSGRLPQLPLQRTGGLRRQPAPRLPLREGGEAKGRNLRQTSFRPEFRECGADSMRSPGDCSRNACGTGNRASRNAVYQHKALCGLQRTRLSTDSLHSCRVVWTSGWSGRTMYPLQLGPFLPRRFCGRV